MQKVLIYTTNSKTHLVYILFSDTNILQTLKVMQMLLINNTNVACKLPNS